MIKPYVNESSKCALLLDICNNIFLDQVNNEPTTISGATKNIFDLVFDSHPNFIENCRVSGGLSDHLMLCFSLNFKPKICKKQPRKIFLYGKGDMTSSRSDLNAFQSTFFFANPDQHTVQENWDLFKSNVTGLMDRPIPSKMSRSNSKPWITRELRRKSKKKQKLFNKAKSTGRASDWSEFHKCQKQLQKKLGIPEQYVQWPWW